jgi:hypothetical protein
MEDPYLQVSLKYTLHIFSVRVQQDLIYTCSLCVILSVCLSFYCGFFEEMGKLKSIPELFEVLK